MSQSDKVILNSLSIVGDELVAAIEHAAGKLEQFVSEPDNDVLLADCEAAIRQLRGTFRLIQLEGADLLADEMLALTSQLVNEDGSISEKCLGVLTNAFFLLPRYIEYTQQIRRGLPVLLVTCINELRQLNKRPAIPESQFFYVDCKNPAYKPKAAPSELAVEDFDSLARRLRHMYQVGLLNALQGKQVRSAVGILQRSMERLEIITGGHPLAILWSIAGAALEVLRTNNMELNKSRKMLLTALDRQIKSLQSRGISYLETAPPEPLLRQLLFVLMLAHRPSAKAQEIIASFDLKPLGYSDQDLCSERESLQGPSVNTVASVAAVINDELRSIKDVLESVAESRLVAVDDFEGLTAGLTKVADILAVVGLASASASLKEQVPRVEAWQHSGERVDAAEMMEVANSLLFVESTLSGLESLNLTSDKLTAINKLAQRDVIASSHLAEAETLVIQEAEAGLTLVKRALNGFAESNYDYGHIKNVGMTLNGVRGGMIVLGLSKAAAVIESCIEFVEGTLLASQQPVALQQLLETFADAVIGLEYYLDAIKFDRQADDSVLSIAEESLQALGYRVRIPLQQ